MAKQLISIQAFLDRDEDHEFEGRCLGLITEEEFAALMKFPRLRKKIFTVETTSLLDISKVADIEDMRLVMTVTKDGTGGAVNKPTLFITSPLDIVSSVVNDGNLNLNGKDQSFYILEEV